VQPDQTPSPTRGSTLLLLPGVAAVLAAAYLGLALGAPVLLLALVALAVPAACALAPELPTRRRWLVLGVGLWLAAGLAGAWWLRGEVTAGLLWVLGVLFVLPLPVVPWLYARTIGERP
jgi:hypothetical protein